MHSVQAEFASHSLEFALRHAVNHSSFLITDELLFNDFLWQVQYFGEED